MIATTYHDLGPKYLTDPTHWKIGCFDDMQLFACWQYAQLVCANHARNGVASIKIDTALTDVETHYVGKRAEYAVARFLRIPCPVTVLPRGDQGWDLECHGKTIDVKFANMCLLFRGWKTFVADIAVLVRPYGVNQDPYMATSKKYPLRDVALVGWITREEFAQYAKDYNLGFGHSKGVDDIHLHRMDELKEFHMGSEASLV